MVPEKPIGWSDHGSNGPMSQLGMLEWRDVEIVASFRLPDSTLDNITACVANRVDQMWRDGVVFCISSAGQYTLSYGGPALGGIYKPSAVVTTGALSTRLPVGAFHTIGLSTDKGFASATVNGKNVFNNVIIRDSDFGFSAIGASTWVAIEFDEPSVTAIGEDWNTEAETSTPLFLQGQSVFAENCTANGIIDPAQAWVLKPDWQLLHTASGLCAEASSFANGATISLQPCIYGKVEQQFRNDCMCTT